MLKDTLLVEIGTEELPPKSLRQLATSFLEGVVKGLDKSHLSYGHTHWYATPRRLAILIEDLQLAQEDQIVERKGPAISAAFDSDGNPTKSAIGWARSNGINVEQASTLETDKGKWLFHKATVKGESTASLMPHLLADAVKQLPIPKPMRWGWSDVSFIRPVHNVVALLGEKIVDGTLFGLPFNNLTFGHRFHANHAIPLTHGSQYLATLEEHKVFADFEGRAMFIGQELAREANALGYEIETDESLLEEVSALVEWPVVLIAGFEESFLSVPKEALIYTMKGDQKYFPLLTKDGALTSKFAFVSNIESSQPQAVIKGNEKVIRPRLSDAKFFYDQDTKQTLESRLDSLKKITFQNKLGTVYERSERLSKLSAYIATQIGADVKDCQRAGLLSKTDLTTKMVYEFPEVQGTMGYYYALNDGEKQTVALALEEQYLPKFSGDAVPSQPVSIALALSEKFDTLVGIFGIGMIPKGDKDPFALRRAAIGILRIITEAKIEVSLTEVITNAIALFQDKLSNDAVAQDVIQFLFARCNAFYGEQNVSTKVIQSVLSCSPESLLDLDTRIKAVKQFSELEEAATLAAANKRVANILRKNKSSSSNSVDVNLFTEKAEKALFDAINRLNTSELSTLDEYNSRLNELASLKNVIDEFFNDVMVMVDDETLKNNRLALLAMMRSCFLAVADIALLD